MDYLSGVITHAKYNHWFNERLYDASERLTTEERSMDQAAFFGSIIGTLNHILVGDVIWLRRFLQADIPANELLAADALAWLPNPTRTDEIPFEDWDDLRPARAGVDKLILDWTDALHSEDLDYSLSYVNTRGRPFKRTLGLLLLHFFNHQTHHRGQATTLLFQNGVDPGVTDLIAMLPNDE
ncbi:MAG: DinB family protein [Burkholderiaceae bacterium]